MVAFRVDHNFLMDHQQLRAGEHPAGVGTHFLCNHPHLSASTPGNNGQISTPPELTPPAREEARFAAVDGGAGDEKRSSFIRRDNPRGRDAVHVADLHPRVGTREEQMTRRQHADARVAPPDGRQRQSARGNDAGVR